MQSHRNMIKHLAGIILFVFSSPSPAQNPDAVAVVEKFHATLLEVMQNAGKLGFQGRYNVLAPAVESSFDTPLIVEVILSRYWKNLDETRQKNFVTLFNRLSVSTYASRFNSYDGESFKTLGVEELKKGRLLIRTEFKNDNDTPVKFDYMVQPKDGKWYIISVIANGVNDVALKRTEYTTIIDSHGFDSLVNEIETKIKELSTAPDT